MKTKPEVVENIRQSFLACSTLDNFRDCIWQLSMGLEKKDDLDRKLTWVIRSLKTRSVDDCVAEFPDIPGAREALKKILGEMNK